MVQPQTGTDFLMSLGETKLINSYTALKIKFEFPSTVQYPNLPVRLDFTSIIFPSTGETFCTGLEFLLAMRLGCKITILSGVYIPFRGKSKVVRVDQSRRRSMIIPVLEPKIVELMNVYKNELSGVERKLCLSIGTEKSENYQFLKNQLNGPRCNKNRSLLEPKEEAMDETEFYGVVQELLDERLKHPKGSYMNLLYKFIANAGIGQMARGLNQKSRYDSQTNSTRIQPAGALISPLYAG